MRIKATGAIAAAALIAILAALPAAAVAKQGAVLPTRFVQLHLPGSGGYGITLFAVELPKPHKSFVTLTASKRMKSSVIDFDSSSYSASGAVSAKLVRADLGPYGRIAVRFQPSGPTKVENSPFGRCHGVPNTTQRGAFVGTIRFRGDDGYTEVDADRARGRVSTQGRYFCSADGHHPRHPSHPKKVEEVSLDAVTPHHTLSFSAAIRPGQKAFPGIPPVEYEASSTQACGRVTVSRSVSTEGPAASFAFDRPLSSSTVTPPPPFSGSGTFLRDPSSGLTSWAGNLAVSFPGLDVPLAGDEFDAKLERRQVDPSFGILYAIRSFCPSGS